MKYNKHNLLKEVSELINNTTLTDEELVSISKHFDMDPEDITQIDDDVYGLPVLDIDGGKYLVGHDEDVECAAIEAIRGSFNEFPSSFAAWVLCDAMPDMISYDSVVEMISNGTDKLIKELVDIDILADVCIRSDGYGPYLAHYDYEEVEVGNLLLYRVD